jgi:hypothetical protein
MSIIRTLSKRVDVKGTFILQNAQYSEKLLLSDTVPAASERLGKVAVSSLGNFLCQFITGRFQTLSLVNTNHVIDDGVSHLRGKLIDGTGNRQLFNDYIPLDLIFSPGRTKTKAADNNLTAYGASPVYADRADAANSLFYPIEFEYLFAVNTDVLFAVKNDSDTAISYDLVFHGVRIMDNKTSR